VSLKRKKLYESQLATLSASRMTLETQALTIESANVNLETIKAMQAGAEGLKQIHGAIDIGKVDDIRDEVAEQMELAQEISEAISMPLATQDVCCLLIN
jgi:charged multivesicular body protein 4